jgi:hypothetical protein
VDLNLTHFFALEQDCSFGLMIFLQWGSQVLVDHLREDLQLETLAILEKDCEIQTKMDEAAVVVERRI